MIEQALLEFGVLGVIVLVMGYIIKRLYDDNQKLHTEIRQIQKEANDRFISVITTVNEQQERVQSTVEKVVESLALQEYVAQKIDELQRNRNETKNGR